AREEGTPTGPLGAEGGRAFTGVGSKTGGAAPGEPPMILRISVVAFCCSSASASRFDASASRWSASARRASRSRPVASSSLGDLRATGGLASLDLAGFGPRRVGLPLPPINRPGTGYGERGRLGKGTANETWPLPRVEWREGELAIIWGGWPFSYYPTT